jgi:heme/copper-type cytochrome/quinol oxidase subunit 1
MPPQAIVLECTGWYNGYIYCFFIKLNYIVKVINLRTKGMSMTRLLFTIWAFVTAIIE